MLSISKYARRRGVASSSVRRWLLDLVGELRRGERVSLASSLLPDVVAVERTPGGHYRLRVELAA